MQKKCLPRKLVTIMVKHSSIVDCAEKTTILLLINSCRSDLLRAISVLGQAVIFMVIDKIRTRDYIP